MNVQGVLEDVYRQGIVISEIADCLPVKRVSQALDILTVILNKHTYNLHSGYHSHHVTPLYGARSGHASSPPIETHSRYNRS